MLCTDFFCVFWVIPPTRIGIGCERGQVTASAGKEGGEILHLSPSQKAKVCRQFERFCKDVLECESIDYIRHITDVLTKWLTKVKCSGIVYLARALYNERSKRMNTIQELQKLREE